MDILFRRYVQYQTLETIAGDLHKSYYWTCHLHGEALQEFEEKFSIRRSTASNMLKLMEKDGYIKRVSVENDARLKKIVLTDKAVKIHTKICEDIAARERKLRNALTDEELEAFFRITEKLKKNMENAE